MTARFGRVVTAMVTPFDDSLRLDLDAAAKVAQWLTEHGSEGLVVAGTTGEGPTLSDGEKLDLFRAVRSAVDVPVIAGASTYDTTHSVHLTKEAVRLGVDAVLAVVPYYNKPSQANLVHHFNAIADAAGATPVILYDVPHRTSRRLDAETIIELSRTPNIVAVKDAASDPAGSVRWRAETPDEFEMYSGDDNQTLPFLAVGAVGVISVSAHWAGAQIGEMIAAFEKGDHDLARRLNEKLLPTYAFNSSDAAPSPAPSKAMLRTLGLPVGRCRPPMGPDEPSDLEDRARAVYAELVADPVRITFLGGLGEIGRNCAAFEIDGRILLLDCGLMFPEADMPGIDLVLPDFTWLHENADRIEGCIITHGHEDHAGALSFALRELSFPLYGSELTLRFARSRIEEAGLLDRTQFITVHDGERRRIGPFDVEFLPVTHSVPHGFATAFHTPQGVILHTGDWKLDLTPIDGRHTDLARIGAIEVDAGVRLLLGDSTNVEEQGHSLSERVIGESLRGIFDTHRHRRIVIACFASHIHRIQQIIEIAMDQGRQIATLGLSMKKNIRIARDLGLLRIPDHAVVDIADLGDVPPERVRVISTGSQGEPMSALTRMAANDNKWIRIGPDDTVILSSHPIPGNETSVGKVIDGLHRLGAEVVHSGIARVHATGHAKQEEIKTLLALARPEFMIPVHGEYRHMVHHAQLAVTMGVLPENVLICADGDQVEVTDDGVRKVGEVPAGYLYVDGSGIGDVGHGVLRDRRVLAEEGVVVVIVTIDRKSGEIIAGPEIITRGWVYENEAEDLLEEARQAVRVGILGAEDTDFETIKRHARKALGEFVNQRTRRRPMIVPVVMEA